VVFNNSTNLNPTANTTQLWHTAAYLTDASAYKHELPCYCCRFLLSIHGTFPDGDILTRVTFHENRAGCSLWPGLIKTTITF